MRIQELFEEDDVDVAEIVAMIEAECKPFLEAAEGHLLFRGMKASTDGVLRKKVRMDRRPKNTSQDIHDVVDGWMQRKFGINGRSAAMFTSGDFGDALIYGKAFAVFPIGNFEFVWSPKVSDLYLDVDINRTFRLKGEEGLEEWLEAKGYQDTDLVAAIKSDCEVMVQCEEYFAVPRNAPWFKDVIEALK